MVDNHLNVIFNISVMLLVHFLQEKATRSMLKLQLRCMYKQIVLFRTAALLKRKLIFNVQTELKLYFQFN